MSQPLAYFISWTCYGARLHGDDRGTVDREHNIPNTPLLGPDTERNRRAHNKMKGRAAILSAPIRKVVTDTIVAHCRQRGWLIHALNVRSNHVHIVTSGPACPDRALVEFKAWATRRLREARLIAPTQRMWTDHGSTRYLWKKESVGDAIKYVMDAQGPDLD